MGGHLSIDVEGDRYRVLDQPEGLSIVPEARRPTM
jgi:hypothetical protein